MKNVLSWASLKRKKQWRKGCVGKKNEQKSPPERGENEEKTMEVLSFSKGEPRGKQEQEHWFCGALKIIRQNKSPVCNNHEL